MHSATAGVMFRHSCQGHSHLCPNHLTGLYGHFFLTSSDRGRQYDHDRHDTRERNARGSGVVKLLIFFDRRPSYCYLPNFGRCGRSQDRVSVNCLLVERFYPAEWVAEEQFRTVDHPS